MRVLELLEGMGCVPREHSEITYGALCTCAHAHLKHLPYSNRTRCRHVLQDMLFQRSCIDALTKQVARSHASGLEVSAAKWQAILGSPAASPLPAPEPTPSTAGPRTRARASDGAVSVGEEVDADDVDEASWPTPVKALLKGMQAVGKDTPSRLVSGRNGALQACSRRYI